MRLIARTLFALLMISTLALSQEPLVKQLNLADMADNAGNVVRATVTDVRSEPHPDYPNVATIRISLRVLETAVGKPTSRLTVRLYDPSGRFNPRSSKIIQPGYSVGEELVLFLYPNSTYGLTSVVGGDQGRFRVEHEGSQTFVVNSLGNRGLFNGVSSKLSARGVELNAAQSAMLAAPSGKVELQSFFGVVRQLASAKESR